MSDPQPGSAVISEYIARRGLARTGGYAQLSQVWNQVAGDRIADRTQVIGLQRGVLEIGVVSSALLNELVSFRKIELLQKIQAEFRSEGIDDLRFRLRSHLEKPSDESTSDR